MTLRPSKWLVRAPIALLPFLAAVYIGGGRVTGDLLQRAQEALTAADAGWAQLSVNGRDASLAGDSPSQEALDAAVAAVVGTYGIRLVESSARVVVLPPPVVLQAPTVNPASGEAGELRVTGTWHEGLAAALKASLDGKVWTLGESPELTSDGGGNWSLVLDVDLAPGTYDLIVEVTGPDGAVLRDAGTADITILAPPPPPPPALEPPTVESVETNSPTPVIRGTWPSGVAKTLSVAVGGVTYLLGQAAALKAEADNWTLTLPAPLADGVYDVTAEVGDGAGQVVGAKSAAKLTIDTTAPILPMIGTVAVKDGAVEAGGTWPEGDAVSLIARLAGKVWTLGQDAALKTDGKGGWSFKPELKLDPGTYDLEIEIADRLGNVARDGTRDEVVVEAPPPPPPPPPEMKAPTVTPAESLVARPVVRGTWSEVAAKSLAVTVDGNTYVLGADEALTSDGIGNWSLAVPKPLKDGVYDVVAESTDAAGKTLTDGTHGELLVDAAGPAVPTVSLYSGETSPERITGTWDWQSSKTLDVAIPSVNLKAGLEQGVTSAAGHWSVTLPSPLPPGSHDVVVIATDARGRSAADQTKFEILVKEPPPPPPLAEPTVTAYSGEGAPASIAGTWDEANGKTLRVAVIGTAIKAALGTDAGLKSDGKGNWSLALPALDPGRYGVIVETTDGGTRAAVKVFPGAIEVKEVPPPPPPPPPLAEPTVTAYFGEGPPDAVTGSWDEGNAKTLRVAVIEAGIKATLGTDPALTSNGKGKWSLSLPKLEPGRYGVMVETTDGGARAAVKMFAGAIEVKAPPPPPPPPPPPLAEPTVAAYSGEGSPAAIAGTWDEGNAKTLRVAIIGTSIKAALGSDGALTSDGKGNWSLGLPAMVPGSYSLIVETTDGGARAAIKVFPGAIEVKAPPPPPPYDCAGELEKVTAAAPIRFRFDGDAIEPPYDQAVAQVAGLLNDPRCLDVKIAIEGHADYFGGRLYNDALSIARAQSTHDALAAQGVAPSRMTVVGKGEASPLEAKRNIDARKMNRRVTITIVE